MMTVSQALSGLLLVAVALLHVTTTQTQMSAVMQS
jgi:hypothetical protein